ncbi:MAG: ComF family protein [Micavibrio aeruginosavorus]|uniref:ComF family protein n=1 Tax=Micavibrio aeruginosavorus TaxID=349221 RepID=A0A7T5UHP7_9BACT|nr:MAG: ComF family protein [Micavibrio aeruginosavorus]
MKNNRQIIIINQHVIGGIGERCIEWLLPARCPLTGKPVERQGMVAAEAWATLRFVADPQCRSCGIPLPFGNDGDNGSGERADFQCTECLIDPPPFRSARSALVYDDNSRRLILGFKHGDQTYAVKTFVPWLIRAGAAYWAQAPLLVPVPLHRWRLLRRRYNQAALLTQSLGRGLGLASLPDALLRVRATKVQGHMKIGERARNVRRAFTVNPRHEQTLRGKNIVLVDDVMTTGATVRECTDALLKAGAGSVFVLTIARTVKD